MESRRPQDADTPPLFVRETGTGATVLLIHGTGCDADFWGDAYERLGGHRHVIAYDRRGYSRSGPLPTGDQGLHADDAARIIRERSSEPVTVVGWSMGGIIALCLAVRHPSLVSGLVLQEPPLYARRDPGWDILRKIVPIVTLSKMGMKVRAAERFSRWTYGSGGTGYDDFPRPWREAVRKNASSVCMEIDGGTGESVLKSEDLEQIQHPALGLIGERSLPYYRRAMDRVRAHIPQLEIREIPGGNHAMHIDNTSAWLHAVLSHSGGQRSAE
jgi:3-oxoadipate enol-lactonase